MVRVARFHRGSDAQRLMHAAEVVVHVMQRHGPTVIVELLAESIRQVVESAYLNRQG